MRACERLSRRSCVVKYAEDMRVRFVFWVVGVGSMVRKVLRGALFKRVKLTLVVLTSVGGCSAHLV